MGERPAYDAIVIGSGFGGAVSACRLAESGRRVLVLERGRRWRPEDFPSNTGGRDLVYDSHDPLRRNGWFEFHIFRHMVVATAAGVGGGSMVYANVSVVPPASTFEEGWPPEISFGELEPHFDRVGRMLNVQKIPDSQLSRRYHLMEEAAGRLGDGARFGKNPLAISFDPDWSYDLPDPFTEGHSKRFQNEFGRQQGTCVHCGNCDLGCPFGARNTLDLNYLARAEDLGTVIRPLHLVRFVTPSDGGYEVVHDHLETGARRFVRGSDRAPVVILAAGSLGSTEILLRSRDQYGTLPHVSAVLGRHWSANANFLTPASYFGGPGEGRLVSPTHGPTITSRIDYLDGVRSDGLRYVIEDGGIAPLLRDYLRHRARRGLLQWLRGMPGPKPLHLVLGELRKLFGLASFLRWIDSDDELPHIMPWFANGVDASDGRMYLGRYWYALWEKRLKLDWDVKRSRSVIDGIVARHAQLAESTGGKTWVPPTWRYLHDLITPHPLGGCRMGIDRDHGVVDHRGEVFGYPGLYVIDGAVVPRAIGINPSRTIAAIAERNAGLIGGTR